MQETRCKDSKAGNIGAGFKLYYYDVDLKPNGVGVILKEEHAKHVVWVKRVYDRVNECEAGKRRREDKWCQWLYPTSWL